VLEEVQAELSAGRPTQDFHERLMLLDLGSSFAVRALED
jgi:hypothetical protein